MSRVSTILNRAADEMEKRGKAREQFINRQGNVCAMGAIRIATGSVPSLEYGRKTLLSSRMDWFMYTEAYRALDNYLIEHGFYKTSKQKTETVSGWNDRNNKETVVKVMREAAKHADYVDALTLVKINEENK